MDQPHLETTLYNPPGNALFPYLLSRGNIDANAWNEISAVLTKNVVLFGFNDFSFGHLLKQTKEKTRGRTNDDRESINEPTR